jgi:undecaprenyl-diphosphatase
MTLMQAFILGIIQGLTEFLPISSSAHLVLTPYILGWNLDPDQAFVFNVLVQVGTLVAVIIFFWSDFIKIGLAMLNGLRQRVPFQDTSSRLGWLIILATIPAGVIGLILKDTVENAFNNSAITAIFLLVTAALLISAELLGRRTRQLDQLTWKDALWVGFFQAIAIFPGISRSGATITGGMYRNLERTTAARFSFLISLPIMLAAGGLALLDLASIPDLSTYIPIVLVGFFTSAVVGYLSIRWLLHILNRNTLYGFAAYCLVLGAGVLVSLIL